MNQDLTVIPSDGQVVLREWLDYAVARVPEIHQEMIGTRKIVAVVCLRS